MELNIDKIQLSIDLVYLKAKYELENLYFANLDVLLNPDTLEFVATTGDTNFLIGRKIGKEYRLEFYYITDYDTGLGRLDISEEETAGNIHLLKVITNVAKDHSESTGFLKFSNNGVSFEIIGKGNDDDFETVLENLFFLIEFVE